ncbi:MAG: rhodanese-like domain-containing protein [Ketobacteraceae bacterium]|nr:rhodanese-like domain-containing protein [Ketobacteraceae bacterium]
MKSVRKCFAVICLGLMSVVSWAEAPLEIEGAITVGLEKAKSLYDEGAVFIDVRDRQSWTLGHIEGSVNLDFNHNEFSVLYISEDLDRSTPLVFYTSSALNIRSAMASFFASNWGYTNVYYFREGYYSWMAADLPVTLKMASRSGVLPNVN